MKFREKSLYEAKGIMNAIYGWMWQVLWQMTGSKKPYVHRKIITFPRGNIAENVANVRKGEDEFIAIHQK